MTADKGAADGIPNQYDLDSDNDGIRGPEVGGILWRGCQWRWGDLITSCRCKCDGNLQTLDANNTGVYKGSNNGFGRTSFDGDGDFYRPRQRQ